jgi:hypothetical protein
MNTPEWNRENRQEKELGKKGKRNKSEYKSEEEGGKRKEKN